MVEPGHHLLVRGRGFHFYFPLSLFFSLFFFLTLLTFFTFFMLMMFSFPQSSFFGTCKTSVGFVVWVVIVLCSLCMVCSGFNVNNFGINAVVGFHHQQVKFVQKSVQPSLSSSPHYTPHYTCTTTSLCSLSTSDNNILYGNDLGSLDDNTQNNKRKQNSLFMPKEPFNPKDEVRTFRVENKIREKKKKH